MIELKNVNKYYNNLHVLKDINLVFPDKGLISIVGESGSGKTTLLHVLGGLDNYSGEIKYDNVYKKRAIDEFRKNSIGIIFQEYLLFENLSVYENLVISLNAIGVRNKDEIDKRIKYVLEQVNMYKFRKKLAKNLSGGQQQRISIARALLKTTKILLADEPTGNLDRKNTIEIMNILKKISNTTLVLLVTHNREMANIYSDQIISIKDGVTSDYKIDNINKSLNKVNDDVIYLEDYDMATYKNGLMFLEVYGQIERCKVRLIFKDNRLFMAADYPIEVINQKQIKEKREKISIEEFTRTDYDSSWYSDKEKGKANLISYRDALINFFKPKKLKYHLNNFIFFALGIILAICIANFYSVNYVDTNSFLYLDNAYSIYLNIEQNSSTTMPEFSNYANLPNVNYFINYKTGTIRNNDLQGTYQNIDYQPTVTTNFMFISDILADELICGDKSDIVITTKIAENLFNTKAYDQVLGKPVYVNSKNDEYSGIVSGVIVDEGQGVYLPNRVMSYFITTASTSVSGDFGTFISLERFNYSVIGETVNSGKYVPCYVLEESDYKLGDLLNYDVMVVGYVKVENLPGVYDKNVIFTEKSYVIDYNNRRMIEDHNGVYVNDVVNYLIVEGQDLDSLSLDYCLAPIDSGYEIGEIYKPVGSKLSFEVCGLYTSNYVNSYNRMLINKKTAIMAYCDTSNLWFKTNNLLEINSLVEKPYYIQNVFEHEVEVIKNVNNADIMIYGVISIILFIVYSLFIYISMRSKIHREEHNIAVYRCLGASKGVFIKTHLIDVSILTLFLSIPGYCLTYLILYLTNLFSTTVANHMLVYLNVWSFLIGLLILFFLNFIIGVLPMIKLLSKKPAILISKYDL